MSMKRCFDEDLAPAHKRKKRQAFTAPRNAKTKAIIKRNSIESHLLRLPREIRDKIWTAALGDRFIHLKHLNYHCDDGYRVNLEDWIWRHSCCVAQMSEREAYRLSRAATEASHQPDASIDPYKNHENFLERHRDCTKYLSPERELEDSVPGEGIVLDEINIRELIARQQEEALYNSEYLDDEHVVPSRPCLKQPDMYLEVLRSCRQIYSEAMPILWSTNTFGFSDPATFRDFFALLNGIQKKILRKVDLAIQWERIEHQEWRTVLNMTLIRSLTGLRELYLCVEQTGRPRIFEDLDSPLYDAKLDSCLDCLSRLQVLPFEHVTAIFGNSLKVPRSYHFPDEPIRRWTCDEKRELADIITRQLLDPNGEENYNNWLEEEKDRRWEERYGRGLHGGSSTDSDVDSE